MNCKFMLNVLKPKQFSDFASVTKPESGRNFFFDGCGFFFDLFSLIFFRLFFDLFVFDSPFVRTGVNGA